LILALLNFEDNKYIDPADHLYCSASYSSCLVVLDPPHSIRLLPGWLVVRHSAPRSTIARHRRNFLGGPLSTCDGGYLDPRNITPTIHRDIDDDHSRHSGLAFTGVAYKPGSLFSVILMLQVSCSRLFSKDKPCGGTHTTSNNPRAVYDSSTLKASAKDWDFEKPRAA
jgi:hypothetical protein